MSFKIQNKWIRVLLNLLVTLLVGVGAFYILLPPLNPHSRDFYIFIGGLCIVYLLCSFVTSGLEPRSNVRDYFSSIFKKCKITAILLAALAAVYIVGSVSSWEVLRAGAYRDLITVENGDFTQDVEEISFDQIPMLDKDSAEKLGDRKLGELSDMVSQFEVGNDYSQINFNGRPVRVTPLVYGDVIKWFNNRSSGLPAYMIIDMATQSVDVVRLNEGIRYSPSEHFGRFLMRHLRFQYPTYMFSQPTFEIDDDKNPYWVCPRIKKTIGLFGGTDIDGAVLVNAVTGESQYYEEVPTWVDRVYPADLIVQQYDYHGRFIKGFLNSVFGQKDVTTSTSGYNYIALNDDVYMYTGVTTAGSDQSNVGFLLSNQRTKETKYYVVPGATEQSAMASAEGVVQHLKYTATFPLLLNVASEPTYFIPLKDNAQLVKMYAMVNVQQYQVVATGASVSECEAQYTKLLAENNITEEAVIPQSDVSGVISEIRSAVINGNTCYYIRVNDDPSYYMISAADSEAAVILNPGDRIDIKINETEKKADIIRATAIVKSKEAPLP